MRTDALLLIMARARARGDSRPAGLVAPGGSDDGGSGFRPCANCVCARLCASGVLCPSSGWASWGIPRPDCPCRDCGALAADAVGPSLFSPAHHNLHKGLKRDAFTTQCVYYSNV